MWLSLNSPSPIQSFHKSEWAGPRRREDNQQPSHISEPPEPTSPPPYCNPENRKIQSIFNKTQYDGGTCYWISCRTMSCFKCTELNTYFTEDDLWRQILWSPTKRPGSAFHSFCKSEICYLKRVAEKAGQNPWPHALYRQNRNWYWLDGGLKSNCENLYVPVCSLADQSGGSLASDLGRWDPGSEGIQRSVQSGLRRSGHVVHCNTYKPQYLQSNTKWINDVAWANSKSELT